MRRLIPMEIEGKVTQLIPPERIGGYAVPHTVYKKAVHEDYWVAFIRKPFVPWYKRLWYHPINPLARKLARTDHPAAAGYKVLVDDPDFHEGEIVELDVEQVMRPVEGLYEVNG
jgi:hypothetical protein